MLLAFFSYYRVGAVFGFLLVSVCAGASADVPTLTEAGPLLTATVGLVIPITGLGLFALSSEVEEGRRFTQKNAAFAAGIYAIACLASAPISVSFVGLIMPSLSSRLPGLLEMAFVLLVASVGATIMIGRDEKLDWSGLVQDEREREDRDNEVLHA